MLIFVSILITLITKIVTNILTSACTNTRSYADNNTGIEPTKTRTQRQPTLTGIGTIGIRTSDTRITQN